MSSPAPVDVGDALDELVNQFADPMSFFRELIQNSLDAGSDEVEIEFEFEPSAANPEQGAMIVIVTDFGSGMDREIIDKQLTRLFSSSKDGDMTKIGKFGIGFVSVFAIQPDAVCVDTGRAGERWRVLFGADRTFKRLKLDEPIEGTTVRLIKTTTRTDYEAFILRAREVVGYWCRHARGEIRFRGEVISEPFGLEAPLVVSYRDEFSEIYLGHRGGATLHGFYNGGLTLIEGDHLHPSSIPEFHGIAFKVSSRYLEHTLSRDDVIKEENFEKVVKRVRELVVGKLRDDVFGRLDRALRAKPGSAEALRDDELAFLYTATHWHLRHAKGELSRELRKLGAALSVGGRVWTWAELQKAVPHGHLMFSTRSSPLASAIEARDVPVLRALGSIDEGGLLGDGANHALVEAIDVATGNQHVPTWISKGYVLPLEPSKDERQRWLGLTRTLDDLLDDAGYKVAAVQFGRFAESGSQLDGRIGVSQREFGEATPWTEAGMLGKGLLDRKRVLVVDADHPSVGSALALATKEPELAAYQLAKTFLLIRGAIDQQDDTKLCQAAMQRREERCRRQPS
jgi:hypothetical protein